MYQCGECNAALEPGRVASIIPATRDSVKIEYVCECSPGEQLTGRYGFSMSLLTRLIGKVAALPWRSPTKPEIVAEDDPRIVQWRWELDQLADSDEFLWWVDHS